MRKTRTELVEHRSWVYLQAIQNLINKAAGQYKGEADPEWTHYRWEKLKRVKEGK